MERYRQAIQAYGQVLEKAGPESLDALLALCAAEVEFRDPFNHTFTKADFHRVLTHMFRTVDELEFEIHDIIGENKLWVLKWTFSGKLRPIGRVRIEGLSEVALNDQGLVTRHIDYWDSWAEVFCKFPLIGTLFRQLGRMARA
ncbi:MAG: nuclear transport factor 2 family protein [Rhizobiales bacterium]|nr:nuclear transport factor 2 family protein [Hyphomicrobiales bacterium]